MKHALALLTTLLLSQLVTAHAAKPGSDRIKADIIYKTTEQGPLKLDLHYPPAAKAGAKYPLVIFTHGGGWTAGDKTLEGFLLRGVKKLNAQGFCVASVDYRLCKKIGNIRIRDCVTDAKDALRFLAKHAQQFSLDAERVFTFGDSAGGHLAQMVLLSPPESFPGDPALADARYHLVAGVSWYGPCDFEKSELFNQGDRANFRDRFGRRILQNDADPQTKLAAYHEVSPVNYLKPSSPPLLMVQGDMDTTIPVHHAHYMKERADAIKAPVETLIVQNVGHNWKKEGGAPSLSHEEISEKTAEFMKQQLHKASPSPAPPE